MSPTPGRDGLAAMWAPLPDHDTAPAEPAEGHPVWHDATAADRAVSGAARRVRVVVVAGDAPDRADQLAMVDLWPAGDTAAVEWSLRDADTAPTVLAALRRRTPHHRPRRRRRVVSGPHGRPGAEGTTDGHALTAAVENALDALAALSAAVAECADARTVRDVARITGLPRQTVHRWRTDPPGAKRLAAVRDSLRDAGCG